MAKIGFSPFSNHNTDSRSERPNYYDALFLELTRLLRFYTIDLLPMLRNIRNCQDAIEDIKCESDGQKISRSNTLQQRCSVLSQSSREKLLYTSRYLVSS